MYNAATDVMIPIHDAIVVVCMLFCTLPFISSGLETKFSMFYTNIHLSSLVCLMSFSLFVILEHIRTCQKRPTLE